MADAPCTLVAQTPLALHLTVDLDRHPDIRQPLEDALGVPLPTPNELSGTDPLVVWLGPQDWLILCRSADVRALHASLAKEISGKPVLISVAGDGLAAFTVSGPDAASRLSSGTGLDLSPEAFPVGASAITKFAQLRATIYRQTDRYTLIVERQFARHAQLWLARPAT